LARIGAFTGTTVNTVLGFFRALFRKDSGATMPSDIGGTFDNATDSNEAIRDNLGGAALAALAAYNTTGVAKEASLITLAAAVAAIGAGAGAIEHEVTITNAVGTFISDVDCWVYTEAGMVNLVASGKSDALGAVTFWLDAGTYYIKCQKSGVNFSNPTAFTVI
jgi:hypothetical protein